MFIYFQLTPPTNAGGMGHDFVRPFAQNVQLTGGHFAGPCYEILLTH